MKTQVTITMDANVKKELQSFAKGIGTTMSSLLNLAAQNLVKTKHINFDFSDRLTPEEEKIRQEAMKDLEKGVNIYTREEFKKHFNH